MSATQVAQTNEILELAESVRSGLNRHVQKQLSCRYLYDDVGSALFEAITYLPEYGLTRAEERLLCRHSKAIAEIVGSPLTVAELGSGTGRKTRRLLEAFSEPATYCPIDVSASALRVCVGEMKDVATVYPIEATYLEGLEIAQAHRDPHRPFLVLFLGSTIGNFAPQAAAVFLGEVRRRLRPGDRMLLGADLVKPAEVFLRAYDDPAGVTAAFNKNLLARLNRELDADFDPTRFAHEARYNSEQHRVEMHLRSLEQQKVSIKALDLTVAFEEGETIWTESSYKFTVDDLDEMARGAGFRRDQLWVDTEWPFAGMLWAAG